MNKDIIRHSALPKLAACPCYVPAGADAGPAAQRGTLLDTAYRAAIAGNPSLAASLEAPEDRAAVQWAVSETLALAEGHKVETREEWLRMHTPGIAHVGTADALCELGGWVADLKTGQMRGYYEQMAAYAYACMDRFFALEWTCHVLYCDQRQRASYRFTFDDAKHTVEQVVRTATNPERKPTPCDYCGWCGAADRCEARVNAVTDATAIVMVPENESISTIKARIMASPERMGNFLAAWKIAEKEIAEPVEKAIRESLSTDPESIPGWKLGEVAGREYFDHIAIVRAAVAGKSGLDALVLALGGKMSGKQFRAWCEFMRIPVDESLARVGAPLLGRKQNARWHLCARSAYCSTTSARQNSRSGRKWNFSTSSNTAPATCSRPSGPPTPPANNSPE